MYHLGYVAVWSAILLTLFVIAGIIGDILSELVFNTLCRLRAWWDKHHDSEDQS